DPESHQVLSMIESIYRRLPEPRLYATIRAASHFSFGDQILLNSQAAVALLRLVGFPALDGRRGLAISNAYVVTFFDVTLNGAPASTLERLSERYLEVSVDGADRHGSAQHRGPRLQTARAIAVGF